MKFDPAQPSTDMHITINDGVSKETMSSKMEPYLSNIEATQQHDKSHTFNNLFTALPMESSTEITVGSYGIFSRHGSIMKRQARFNIIPCKVEATTMPCHQQLLHQSNKMEQQQHPHDLQPLPLAQQRRHLPSRRMYFLICDIMSQQQPASSTNKGNRSNNNAIAATTI